MSDWLSITLCVVIVVVLTVMLCHVPDPKQKFMLDLLHQVIGEGENSR